MEKRRERHEIVAEILSVAVDGKRKTHIMYRAKLSYTQVNEYLPWLVEKGFLENMKGGKMGQRASIYRTTPRGLMFLENLKSIGKLLARDKNLGDPAG
jgi:predicted transcriptional regulator